MKTLRFDDEESWLSARSGKITGTRLKDIYSNSGEKKKAFYELIAECIAEKEDGVENAMDRGKRLEPDALDIYSKLIGKKVDGSLVLWCNSDDESMAVSPDGIVTKKHAVEVKCLSSASHIEAFLTQEIPKEYKLQTRQYFIVNPDLEILDVVFYDPRMQVKSLFFIRIHRKDIQKEVDMYAEYEKNILKEAREIINNLTF